LSETEQRKKKKKKRQNLLELEKVDSELLPELVDALDELEKQRKYVDIQVCPKCKSPKIRRVKSLSGDMAAHMGLTPPKYECPECGWQERTVVKATNRPTSIRDVAIMAEAKEAETEMKKRRR
jgi:predicted RNA-binding Zn-ribbon protein involved in translation (DUF1610 family)